MTTSNLRFLMPLSLIAGLECPLFGQTLRDSEWIHSEYKVVSASNVLQELGSLHIDAGSTLVEWRIRGSLVAQASLALPVFYAGGAFQCEPRRFVVGGSTAGGGCLARLRLQPGNPRAVIIDEIKVYPGIDIWSVSWNSLDSKLYALDFLGKQVLEASWGGQVSDVLPLSWSIAFTSASLGSLAKPEYLSLVSAGPQNRGINIIQRHTSSNVNYMWASRVAGLWTFTPRSLRDYAPELLTSWAVKDPLTARSSGFWVTRSTAGTFTVVDDATQTVVGGGAIAAANSWALFQPSVELTPGASYHIGPITPSASFTPYVRYGEPVQGGGMRFGVVELPKGGAYVGSQEFGPACVVEYVPPPQAAFQLGHGETVWVIAVGSAGIGP